MDVLTNMNVSHNPEPRMAGLKATEEVAKSVAEVKEETAKTNVVNNAEKSLGADKVVSQINSFLTDENRRVEFSFDKDAGQQVFSVVDKESGDILRQYPSKEMLAIKERLGQVAGVLVDESA